MTAWAGDVARKLPGVRRAGLQSPESLRQRKPGRADTGVGAGPRAGSVLEAGWGRSVEDGQEEQGEVGSQEGLLWPWGKPVWEKGTEGTVCRAASRVSDSGNRTKWFWA